MESNPFRSFTRVHSIISIAIVAVIGVSVFSVVFGTRAYLTGRAQMLADRVDLSRMELVYERDGGGSYAWHEAVYRTDEDLEAVNLRLSQQLGALDSIPPEEGRPAPVYRTTLRDTHPTTGRITCAVISQRPCTDYVPSVQVTIHIDPGTGAGTILELRTQWVTP